METRFLSAGDCAFSVEFGLSIDRATSARVMALDRALAAAALPGVVEAVPTFRSLMVHYDPLVTSRAELEASIGRLVGEAAATGPEGRAWRIPVCYAGELAPDLAAVADRTGLGRSRVIELHAERAYYVYMMGFLPGLAYMGDLAEELYLPRRPEPRVNVPAGSVAIATSLTTIYPLESPGGWHLIGRTPAPLFDLGRAAPTLLAPGDAVRFEPVDLVRFHDLARAFADGELDPATLASEA